jgi:hypothetical protein
MSKLTRTVTKVIDVNELGQILMAHYKANTVLIQAVKVGNIGRPEIFPVGVLGGLDIEVDIVVERDREDV